MKTRMRPGAGPGMTAGRAAGLGMVMLTAIACAGSPDSGNKADEPDKVTSASTVDGARDVISSAIEPAQDGKSVLVVYYSLGNAGERVAADLAELFSADVEKIVESHPRRWSFFSGGAASVFGTKVEIEPSIRDPETYDRIFVLTPVWAWRLSPPVKAWLKEHAGKLPEAAYGTISGDTEPEKIVAAMAKAAKREPFAYAGFSKPDFLPENRDTYIKKLRLLAGFDKR
jgi:hypothetical protein